MKYHLHYSVHGQQQLPLVEGHRLDEGFFDTEVLHLRLDV